MHTVYTRLMVYYLKTIDGTLTNVIPSANGFKIMIRLAIDETNVQILILCRESWHRLQPVNADSDSWRWVLTIPGGRHLKPLTRSEQIYMPTLTNDGGPWQDQGDSMRSLWQDHGDYMCGLRQLTVGSNQSWAMVWEASDRIMVTICADSDSWEWAVTSPG
jgi:hypothetical protein